MPRRPRRPCPHPRCPRFRPCALHPSSAPYRGSSTAQGYGAGWHKISARVLAEEPLCPGYPAGVHHGDQVRTTVIDHIRSRRSGGRQNGAMPKRVHPPVPGSSVLRLRLGQRVRELRLIRGLSQSEVGGAYYDRKYVSAVELGRITPSLPALLQFARALGVSISKLVQGTDPPTSRRP